MRNVKLTLEYDGSGFAGWQFQPEQRTVQGELERAVKEFLLEDARVFGAGRTDSGVHALAQVASFRTSAGREEFTLKKGLNAFLPDDVKVLEAEYVDMEFHARQSSKGKCYRYLVLDGNREGPLSHGRAWHGKWRLELGPMREAAAALIGEHDFSSFQGRGCEAKSSVRDIESVHIYRRPCGMAAIDVTGTGFLKQMVRAMAGTLAEVGRGLRAPGEMREILEARDRRAAGVTAPAHGLYLARVLY